MYGCRKSLKCNEFQSNFWEKTVWGLKINSRTIKPFSIGPHEFVELTREAVESTIFLKFYYQGMKLNVVCSEKVSDPIELLIKEPRQSPSISQENYYYCCEFNNEILRVDNPELLEATLNNHYDWRRYFEKIRIMILQKVK